MIEAMGAAGGAAGWAAGSWLEGLSSCCSWCCMCRCYGTAGLVLGRIRERAFLLKVLIIRAPVPWLRRISGGWV